MNIVFLDEYSLGGIDLSRIKQLGNYTGYEKTTPGEIAERCIDADIVITNKVPLRAEAIKVLPQLKLICIAATGMNNVDLEAAAERGIEVRNAVGYSTHAVTETTIGAAIALLRQSIYYDRYVKQPFEKPTVGILLCKEKKDAMVELTLPKDTNIYAAEYALYLPDKKELQQKLQDWIAEFDEEEQ